MTNEWKSPNQDRQIPPSLKSLIEGLQSIKSIMEAQIEKDVLEMDTLRQKLARIQNKNKL